MKKHILYIVNPVSGTQRKKNVRALAEERTDPTVYEVHVAETAYAGHAAALAREAADEGFDVVVAVGGDGTVNEVARSLVGSETALAIVPCGSGNGLARHLCVPLDAARAIDIINEGVVHRLDYGTINERPFFCTCGVGFDAFISEKFAASEKRGLLTYVENTLKAGLLYKPQTYILEDETGSEQCRAFLIAAANASQYGNDALIAPYASMRDGLLDVVVMSPFNALEAPIVAMQLLNGKLPGNAHVHTFKTNHLRIRREGRGVAHYDGDPFVTGEVIDIRLHPQGLNVVVNQNKDHSVVPSANPIKNLTQLIPEFWGQWHKAPGTFLKKLGAGASALRLSAEEKEYERK